MCRCTSSQAGHRRWGFPYQRIFYRFGYFLDSDIGDYADDRTSFVNNMVITWDGQFVAMSLVIQVV